MLGKEGLNETDAEQRRPCFSGKKVDKINWMEKERNQRVF